MLIFSISKIFCGIGNYFFKKYKKINMIFKIGEEKFNNEINFLEIVKKLRKLDIILKSKLITNKIKN
jgi:hypothetical protein